MTLDRQQKYFCDKEFVREFFKGKSVAIVGSGPGVMDNDPGFIDSFDVVVRANNYKLFPETGFRTDAFYSFFGNSIKKKVKELKRDGVHLCMCKCPNAKFMESKWHRLNKKERGTDFRYIYDSRKDWWFCKTYVPTVDEFIEHFDLLGKHIPTTGFSAILDVLKYEPKSVYITGFDFFQSGIHNVNERWKEGKKDDPICHVPHIELKWLKNNLKRYPITLDKHLKKIVKQ